MSRQILINAGIFETRIAILEGGQLVDFYAERGGGIVGNIYKGRVDTVLPGMDAAFVDIGLPQNAFLHVSNVVMAGETRSATSRREARSRSITEVVKPGQEILVQVERAPVGTKGPRVSTRFSLPGRFLVLIGPDTSHVGVSRRIEDPQERSRLRALGEKLRTPERALIIRTEAEGATEEELKQDVAYLTQLWDDIHARARRAKPPALIHQDVSVLYRVCRDFFTADVDRLIVDNETDYHHILHSLDTLAPDLKDRVELYQGARPLFLQYGLEAEIETALQRDVPLHSGGHITIDETEALTVIDVNTGKFVGTRRLADTILTTNLEAAEEIARQLRLRDIGGIIIIDFIDMDRTRDRVKVYSRLEQALARDRARTRIVHISPLALVEVTRKRTGDSLSHEVSDQCPHCQGRGRILSGETIAIRTENQLAELAFESRQPACLVQAHPEVVDLLIGPGGETAALLEERLGRELYIRARDDFAFGTVEISTGTPEEIAQKTTLFKPQEVHRISPRDVYESRSNQTVAILDGYVIGLPEGVQIPAHGTRIKLTEASRSFGLAQLSNPVGRRRSRAT